MENDNILQVKDLTINFRTNNGQVQAVREVSFDLKKGETLAIVGESGSGKSVTSRAILGILANNGIVKKGRILFDGKDLIKVSEEEFHHIRGDKIAMIFQDPMSSLNPIMRVGKQLTEAMILKNKANRRDSRKNFNTLMAKLVQYMDTCGATGEVSNAQKAKDFNEFEYKHLELENAFTIAKESGEEAISIGSNMIFELEKNSFKNYKQNLMEFVAAAKNVGNEFFVTDFDSVKRSLKIISDNRKIALQNKDFSKIIEETKKIMSIIEEAQKKDVPNFFGLGYYLTFVSPVIPTMDVKELNELTHKALDDNFMLDFIDRTVQALKYSHNEKVENTKVAKEKLEAFYQSFKEGKDEKSVTFELLKAAIKEVSTTIDALDIYKSDRAYTFQSGVYSPLKLYYNVDKINAKRQKKYDRDKSRYDAIIAKGKQPNGSVIPLDLWNKEDIKKEILECCDEMLATLDETLNATDIDFTKKAVDIIDYFKQMASNITHVVNKHVAKNNAIKLLKEVGIAEPYRRYRQYPFEFSGGMRQRIVIAIALAANPDILICDEPTTALDVTIQSQILELINKIKEERKLSIIFITHDMGVVANMADKIAVMYAGKIVETGTSHDVFYDPRHPYTWALLSSMPDLDTKEKLDSIPGTPPNMIYPPKGDAFAARNKYALKIDFEMQPPLFKVSDTHYAATWLLAPQAPKVEMPKTLVERIERMKKAQGVL